MDGTINSMEDGFKDLVKYSDEQFHTINKLNKELEKLKSENESLKIMLAGNLPSLGFNPPQVLGLSNEQLICETQITLLKERALQKELNADEVRRFTQLYEVLEKIRGTKENVDDAVFKKMSTEDLLKLAVIDVSK